MSVPPRPDRAPRSAIVIPHHDQSGYAPEAIACALAQHRALVVVVDDASSAPHRAALQETVRLAGNQVMLLQRDANGGLSAARNTGIEWVLRHHPNVEFILPLDADDLIEGTTIQRLEAEFDQVSDASVGWLYGDGTLFGTFEAMARMPRRFTGFRLRQENLCFSTSFIHRRVFDTGLRFDESLRHGFEDWELYLHACERGFRGVHVGDFGFHYRKHGSSMLAEGSLRMQETYLDITARHPDSFARHNLALAEHVECPRFAVVDVDRAEIEFTSSPDRPAHPVDDPRTALDGYTPPLVVVARGEWLDELRDRRMFHQTLSLLQMALRHHAYIPLGWHSDDRAHVRGLLHAPSDDTLAGVAFAATHASATASHLLGALSEQPASPTMVFGPVVAHPPRARPLRVDAELGLRIGGLMSADMSPRRLGPLDQIAASDRAFAFEHAVAQMRQIEVRHRRTGTRNIGVILPWVGLGGMDLILLALSQALADDPRNRVHLLSSESGVLEIGADFAASFETINPTPDLPDNEHAVRAFMEDMDVLLIANSDTAVRMLPIVRRRTSPMTLVFIQNVELTPDGVAAGWLYPMARQYDDAIDGYVVPSKHSAEQILGFGVARHKVLVVPNAPIYRPPPECWNVEEAIAGKHQGLPGRPLRILYAGRFDRQKGMDRLSRILERLEARGVPFQARLVGRPVLDGEPIPASDCVTVEPPTFDASRMASLFEWADCLVLPSRWEGLPLVMLDAMAFGVAVVTTDVGGIREYVADGRECVLVEDELGDTHVVDRFVDGLAKLHASPGTMDEARLRAHRWATGLTWSSILAQIEAMFPMKAVNAP